MAGHKIRGSYYLAALALVGCGWTPKHVAGAAVSTALLAADWYQTRGITRDCLELNPVIGRCGENVPVDIYFPVVMLTQVALAHAVGADWRPVLLGAVAGAEGATVWSNWSAR